MTPSGPLPELLHAWLGNLEELKGDLTTAFYWRRYLFALRAIVEQNREIPRSYFFAFISQNYGAAQAVAVRRFTDQRRDVVSLVTLVGDLRRHRQEISRDWWLADVPEAGLRDRRYWDSHYGSPRDDRLSGERLDRDIQLLRHSSASVRGYVDEHVAHRSRAPRRSIPTFADIHAALDEVGRVYRKYHILLAGSDYVVTSPIPPPRWAEVFRVAWLPSGAPAPRWPIEA